MNVADGKFYTKTSGNVVKEIGGAGAVTLNSVTTAGAISSNDITLNGANLVFEGYLENAFETTLTAAEPTAAAIATTSVSLADDTSEESTDVQATEPAAESTVAAGGALTIAAGAVENSMLAGSITASKLNNAIFADLETLGAPASDGQFIVATGSGAFAYESANTARTSLGL